MSKSTSTLASRLPFIGIGLLLMVVVLATAVKFAGNVGGDEFAPDTFRRRAFAYLEIPLFGFQVTPISHADRTGKLESHLVTEKLLPPPEKPTTRWDLIQARRGVGSTSLGAAQILIRYLDAVDKDGKQVWLDWSEKHKDLSVVLWPVIAKLARQELYFFIPDMFILAQSATSPEKLQSEIDQALADHYLLAAKTFQSLDQHDAAVELFSEVLVHAPEHPEAVRGLAESQSKRGP